MNRLVEVFQEFSLPELSSLLKRTMYGALGAGCIALIVSGLLGYILFGLGVCIGLGLGIYNVRLITRQATRVSESQNPRPFRALASLTTFRLGVMTALVIGLIVLSEQLGFGALGGIALFYFGFLINLIVPLLKKGFVA